MTETLSSSTLITVDELADYRGPELYLFIGISTAGSRVHAAFPHWAPVIAPGAVLKGVDLAESASPEEFRRLVLVMRDNPQVVGAVITSHKLRMYRAVADLLEYQDPLVGITHEINCLDTRTGGVAGYARDPQSLDIILDTTATSTPQPQRPVTCIGAGGSAIALLLAIGLDVPASIASGQPIPRSADDRRGPLTILGRRQDSLDEIRAVAQRAGLTETDVELVLAEDATAASVHTARVPPGAVVANATGLGKLEPGSPLTGPQAFAPGSVAWDFNYRGPLTFLEQARAAGVRTEDGWDYFLAGWTAALCAVTGRHHIEDIFDRIRAASRDLRP